MTTRRDPLHENAKALVLRTGKLSILALQKEFKWGYSRAYWVAEALGKDIEVQQAVADAAGRRG